MEFLRKLRVLNTNALKFLAAALMLVDHIGLLFFPYERIWRIIGRLSMPLFAFALSEGCRYTKNKARHFSLMFALAIVCQVVYYFFDDGNLYMSILVTFSLSVLLIYAMQYMKKTLLDKTADGLDKGLACVLFSAAVFCVYALCQIFTIDYGFWGVMTPVFASIFDFHRIPAPESLKKFDCLPVRVLCLFIGLIILAISYLPQTISFYALGSLPLLLLYNGKKGKLKTKYFFYIFYPLHLAILQGVYMLL
ncbi:MAG: hypothetical protein IJX96_05240 [Clostridia bacterium]|nr:hypothetical protein [Clostridia bacterium]